MLLRERYTSRALRARPAKLTSQPGQLPCHRMRWFMASAERPSAVANACRGFEIRGRQLTRAPSGWPVPFYRRWR